MANHIKVMVLDVGQGSSNFVEIYEDVGAPPVETLVATILVDLGSDDGSKSALASVNYIDGRLRAMPNPTIDALFLSHGDSDHHNYLVALTKNFKPVRGAKPGDTRPTLTIRSVKYCGDKKEYTLKRIQGGRPEGAKKKINTLTWLKQFMPPDDPAKKIVNVPTEFDNEACTFKNWKGAAPNPAPYATVRDVRMYIVSANVKQVAAVTGAKRARDPEDIIRPNAGAFAANTVSLVLLLDYQGTQFVITGDATGLTIHACNGWLKDYVSDEYLPKVQMLTLPHHGAFATGFGLDRAVTASTQAGIDRMQAFSRKINAKTVTASANMVKKFGHPDIRVVECFLEQLDTTAFWTDSAIGEDRHFFTAWYSYAAGYSRQPKGTRWPMGAHSGFYSLETEANVYSTVYYFYRKDLWLVYPNEIPIGTLQTCTRLTFPPMPAAGQSWGYTVRPGGQVTLAPMVNRTQAPPRSVQAIAVSAPRPVPAGAGVGAGDATARPAARAVRLPGLKVVP